MRKIALTIMILALCLSSVMGQSSTLIQYLSGTDKDHTVPWEFFCTGGRNSGVWTTIPVPSCWELQGFGTYNFGREFWNFGSRFVFADEKGLYKHTFTVPADWKDREVLIVFEGSMTDTEVKINGQPAGPIHQGAFYRFQYNIADKLRYGEENVLEVAVSKMSSNETVNRAERWADYWVFGGIFRPVYLKSLPKEHIEHFAISAKADGSFLVDVDTKNLNRESTLKAEILDGEKVVATFTGKATAGNQKTRLEGRVPNPATWSAETPNLYRVRLSLQNGRNLIHEVSDIFGFRTIEVRRGDGIYLNGTQIKMKGANRHVFWPETGRTVSREVALLDLERVKGMNMNAIRCSHYPPDKDFLYLCDSLGIYVIDELAGWQNFYDTEVGSILVKSMVERDANHPSIIFWGNGNEGGHNTELLDHYARYDPSKRTVIHGSYSFHRVNGIDCNHYPNYGRVERSLQDTMIYMCTEFLHCQDDGGGGAGLEDIWELMWGAPRSGGGFLWALIDETVMRTDRNNVLDHQMGNANDGILGPYREKEGSYYAIREIFSPVKPGFKNLPEEFSGSIPFENRYHFTNLNQCTFNWKLVRYRKPGEFIEGHHILQQGALKGPDVAPLQTGNLQLPLPATWKSADALLLSVTDPSGNEVMNWSFRIRSNADILASFITKNGIRAAVFADVDTFNRRPMFGFGPTARNTAPQTPPKDSLIHLHANDITVTLSPKTGLIKQIRNRTTENQFRLNNGPVLVSGNAKVTEMSHSTQGESQVVEFTYEGDLKYVKWTMHPSGWLEMDYSYSLKGPFEFTGITFSYPEKHITGIRWLGNGPYRVWKNRPQGMPLDVWAKLYNDTQTGSAPWIYPEFKGYHSDMVWVEMSAVEGRFIIASNEKDLFLRLLNFSALDGAEQHPVLPRGDISFLDHIPATGTRMAININQRPGGLGPMSQTNQVDGTFTRKLYFYFAYPEPPK